MAGLLDMLNDEQGLLGLHMLAAAGPSAQPASFGQRLLGGYSGYRADKTAAEERKQKKALQELQMGLLGSQIEETKAQAQQRQAQAEQQQKDRGLLSAQYQPMPGPTQDGGPLMPRFDPRSLIGQGASMPAVMNAIQLEQALKPPKPEAYTLSPGQQRFEGGKPVAGVPDKPAEAPSDVRAYEYAKAQGYGGSFLDFQIAQKRAGASSTTVSLGSPVPVTLPDGTQGLVQPANRPGEPPQIMRLDGGLLRPPPKEMPAGMAEKFATNEVTLNKIDQAISMVKTNPGALGVKNYLPDAVMQRADPKGVQVRAMVADIGGQKIHDRSGAAVTVSEAARLKPYIPAATDSPEAVATKLQMFRSEYAAMQKALASGASIKQAAAAGSSGSWEADKEARYQAWKRQQGMP